MRTETVDIERIIAGSPVEIDLPFPLDPQPTGGWWINQPADWLDDMANAEHEAALALALNAPSVAAVKDLPPSDEWIATQKAAWNRDQARVDELAAIETRTPEDDLELTGLIVHQTLLYSADNTTRADELARPVAQNAMVSWLLPRLIVDGKGKLIFDQGTAQGRELWRKMGKENRKALFRYLYYVRELVQKAKNYKPGQSSN